MARTLAIPAFWSYNDPMHKYPLRLRLGAVLPAVFLAVFLAVPAALAADGIVIPSGAETNVAWAVGQMIIFLNIGIWAVFVILNSVMDPIFMFNIDSKTGTSPLMDMMNNVWVLSRDLMNIIFAVALIGVGIYTLVTHDKQFVSDHVKKFVLAVVLVNFSWFFPRLILDVANIATSAIYGIPSMIQSDSCSYQIELGTGSAGPPPNCRAAGGGGTTYNCDCMVVTDVQFFLKDRAKVVELTGNAASPGLYKCPLGTLLCYKAEVMKMNELAPFSAVLNGLVVNHMRLGQLAQVPRVEPGGRRPTAFLVFLIKNALILAIHIAIFFPLLAMTAAFLIRIPVLWLTIGFMPFMFLDSIGADKLGIDLPTKKIFKYFVHAAFMPAITAVPLAVGFVLLNAGTAISNMTVNDESLRGLQNIGIRIWDCGTADTAGICNFYQLIWLAMCLAVIWTGVFAALGTAEFGKGITQKIKSYGEGLGELAIKAPLAAPVIPGVGTPLAAMKTFHPKAIASGIENNKEGLAGYIKGFQKNGSKDATRDSATDKLAGDTTKIGAINTIINEYHTGGDKDPAKLVKKLQDEGFSHINAKNLAEELEKIDAELRKKTTDKKGFEYYKTNKADINRKIGEHTATL